MRKQRGREGSPAKKIVNKSRDELCKREKGSKVSKSRLSSLGEDKAISVGKEKEGKPRMLE